MTTDEELWRRAQGKADEARSPADDPQLDLFIGRASQASVLESELWHRRQDRREAALTALMSKEDADLAPLIMALARLAAQRDARATTNIGNLA